MRAAGVLTGHTDWILAAAWSPDGARLATGGADRTVRIWDPGTRATIAVLDDHIKWVRTLAWSPDGAWSVAGDNRGLRLWDRDGQRVATVDTGHRAAIHSVAWSRDGAYLACGDLTGLVIVRDRDLLEVTSLQLQPSQCFGLGSGAARRRPARPPRDPRPPRPRRPRFDRRRSTPSPAPRTQPTGGGSCRQLFFTRHARSNGSRQAFGAISWWIAFGPQLPTG